MVIAGVFITLSSSISLISWALFRETFERSQLKSQARLKGGNPPEYYVKIGPYVSALGIVMGLLAILGGLI